MPSGSGIAAALVRTGRFGRAEQVLHMAKAKKLAKTRAKSALALKVAAPTKLSEPTEAALSSPAPSVSEYMVGDQILHPMFGRRHGEGH